MVNIKKPEPAVEPAVVPVEPAVVAVEQDAPAEEAGVEVEMLVRISGTRNGVDWPRTGGRITLPAGEAAELVANRQAKAAGSVETAVANVADVETATPQGHRAISVQEAKEADKAKE